MRKSKDDMFRSSICMHLKLKLIVSLQGLESMFTLAQKCMHLKPISNHHKLMGLLIGILEENTEVRNMNFMS